MRTSDSWYGQPRLHSDEDFERFHATGLFGDRLLVDHVDARAAGSPCKVAFVERAGSLTYSQVVRASENLAAGLARLGIGHGDVVAVRLPNWSELPIIHLATDRIGAIFLPLSEGFGERELAHLLTLSAAKVLFTTADSALTLQALSEATRFSKPRHVLAVRGDAAAAGRSYEWLAQDDSWRTVEGHDWLTAKRGNPDAPSHVMVSSGTTGMPRCSLFSDNNTLVKILGQYVPAVGLNEHDIAAAIAPSGTGATGYNYPIVASLLVGGTSVLLDHWSGRQADEVLALIRDHGCTAAVVVPTQLIRLVEAAAAGPVPTTLRVITYSGARLAPAVAEEAETLFGCVVQGIYGSSEAGATAMTRPDDPAASRHATVGRPLAGQEVRIIGGDGRVLQGGTVGEVQWRGANKSYGFLNDLTGTRQVWGDDGWLRSGDLGYLDSCGYLNLVGRKKDMIIRGGQNVNPSVIEDVLVRHPLVSEVAVVPFEDPHLGERIAVCIVAAKGSAPSLESLREMILGEGLAPWNQPERIIVLPELPRNAGGKVDKRSLALRVGELREAAGASAGVA